MFSLTFRRYLAFAGFSALLFCSFAPARAAENDGAPLTGRELYRKACAACHGVDGTGAPSSTVGFDTPLPDLTDCNFATREPDGDWYYVIAEGGPARGFSQMMPAYGEALSKAEIQKILDYIRTFCQDERWPRGEFNLPRALVTTKAYPEDELVLSATFDVEGEARIETEIIYEQRFGARNQVEVIFPFGWSEQAASGGPGGDDTKWTASVGDIGLAYKRVMFHSLAAGSILSLGLEVFFPTGDDDRGFGSNTFVFEPYLAFGQILPADFFFQFQGGAGLPVDTGQATEEAFWRAVLGKTFLLGRYGKGVSPMVEVLGSHEFASGATTHWDVVPQAQVPLNRRQHILLCAGARVPLNDTDNRDTTYLLYVLWDWFDGGFFEGW